MADRIMHRLSQGGRTSVFLGAIVVVLIALFLPGWAGAVLLTVIVAAMGWLLSKTWPVTSPQTRAIRIVVLAALAAVAIAKAM